MSSGAVKQIGSFHDGLGEGRVRMDRQAHIGYIGSHFNGQSAFSDHFARAGAGNPHTDDAFALGINDKLCQSVIAVQGGGSTGSGPGKPNHFVRDTPVSGLFLRQSDPRNFRIGKHDRRYGRRFVYDLAAVQDR